MNRPPTYWYKAKRTLSKKDSVLRKIIKKYNKGFLATKNNPFFSLCRTIVGQQISTKAADSIWAKFEKKCKNKINPSVILKTPSRSLKSAGLSRQKIEYIKSTATFFIETKYTNKNLSSMEDDDLKNKLITIKGIGPWTIDMILIFSLGRPDVFPVGDLAIRKGFNILFKKEHTEKQMINEAKNWKPYRTIFSWYLWRVIDGSWESM